MIFISHRGNIHGKEKEKENTKLHINRALDAGFDVEIDIRFLNNNLYLGHDNCQEKIDINYLKNKKFWCHAKDLQSLEIMINNDIHCFFHDQDDYTLTSKKFIWAYPGKLGKKKAIAVLPELNKTEIQSFDGICSDIIFKYRKDFFQND